jgi:hypothetical protein
VPSRLRKLARSAAPSSRGGADGSNAESLPLITVFDPRIADDNLGNQIICESVFRELRDLFPDDLFVSIPAIEGIGDVSVRHVQRSRHTFFAGTNVLSSEMETYREWGIDRSNVGRIRNVILVGVGWWQYQDDPSPATRNLLRAVLHPTALHSVRDEYTAEKLRRSGFQNVLNTSDPTLWEITPDHCAAIPRTSARNVLTTFTSYAQAPALDRVLAEELAAVYDRMYVWVQAPEDLAYARDVAPWAEPVAPHLDALDALLSSDLALDYVGTRLHAGIRAIQHKRRSLIVGVDNRAVEISRDVGLPVVRREELAALPPMLTQGFETAIRVPTHEISRWKAQFESTGDKTQP